MVRIKTKIPVLYDARENKYGIVVSQLEVKKNTLGYFSTITDFVEKESRYIPENTEGEPIEEQITTYLEQINQKHITISNEEINTLFGLVNHQVPADLPYFEREQVLFSYAFLVYVQNDFIKDEKGRKIEGKTIYNISPDNWEITN